MPHPVPPPVIGNWYLLENLGSGYSGSIYRAVHVHTQQQVALKIQTVDHECPTNRYERHIYPLIQGGIGMPTLWSSGVHLTWDYLAIDLLGSSLDALYKQKKGETMDLRSVCSIAMQVIARLEFMHDKGVLHRDIQLGNCVIGKPPHHKTIYMIDFGFSKRYIDPHTRRHIPDSKEKRDFIGNYWFSSVGVHCRGKVPSRRDDLEAAALMFIHLLTPRGLSWTRNGVPKTDHAHNRLKKEKRDATPEDLCRGLPSEFEDFLRYCRHLKFMERPDYAKWIQEFRSLARSSGFSESNDFVWPPTESAFVRAQSIERGRPVDEIADLLDQLKHLELGNGQKNNPPIGQPPPRMDLTTDSEKTEGVKLAPTLPKAYRLSQLNKAVMASRDNVTLAALISEFIDVLHSNSSRMLTREGFNFLDALNHQLSQHVGIIVPLRTSRSSSQTDSEESSLLDGPAERRRILTSLRIEVGTASSKQALATLVADFGRVTNKSSGRTITKDGFMFLEGLARRLKTIQ